MPLTLLLNGKSRIFLDLGPDATLDMLVTALGLQGDRVAVERNGEIVARSRWSESHLAENDQLEVVHFVGGGTGGESTSTASKQIKCSPSYLS